MAKIRVKFDNLDSNSDTTKRINTQVSRINSEFMSICNSLDWDIQSAGGIRTTANKINSGLGDDEQSLRNLSAFLSRAANDYRELDSMEVDVGDLDGSSGDSETDENKTFTFTFNSISEIMSYSNFPYDISPADIFKWSCFATQVGVTTTSYTVTITWNEAIANSLSPIKIQPYSISIATTYVPNEPPFASWLI